MLIATQRFRDESLTATMTSYSPRRQLREQSGRGRFTSGWQIESATENPLVKTFELTIAEVRRPAASARSHSVLHLPPALPKVDDGWRRRRRALIRFWPLTTQCRCPRVCAVTFARIDRRSSFLPWLLLPEHLPSFPCRTACAPRISFRLLQLRAEPSARSPREGLSRLILLVNDALRLCLEGVRGATLSVSGKRFRCACSHGWLLFALPI